MIAGKGLPFIKEYVNSLNTAIELHSPEQSLTKLQCCWLTFIILGILVTNTVCWQKIERFSLGKQKAASLSWMFRKAKIAWDWLLLASTMHIVARYGITTGTLAIDDSDIERSKNASNIGKVHKIKDKKRNGYFNGQNIVFLLLVTKELTFPVGFSFYEPDPELSAWNKEDKRLRKKGVSKEFRPSKPERNSLYPTKIKISLNLLKNFVANFTSIKIKAVVADNLYATKEFIEGAAEITKQKQIITQIKQTQLINVNGRFVQVSAFFKNYSGKTEIINLRGNQKKIVFCGGKFKVKSLGKKYYVIALKYDNESEYRYLIAHDSSWRDVDIIEKYSYRWLVEVFIQDWKSYEGWDQLAKQTGEEGSEKSLILSLLCDHALLVHQEQEALFKNQESAATVGSLREKVMMESLTSFIEDIVMSENPQSKFQELSLKIMQLFSLRHSTKHLRHVDTDVLGDAA